MLPPAARAECGGVRDHTLVQGRCVVDRRHRLHRPPQGLFAGSRPAFTHAYCTPTVGRVSVRYLSPAPSAEPALSAAEYFSGKTAPLKLVSLEDGAISLGTTPVSLPPTAAPAPAKTTSAPPPSAIVVQEVALAHKADVATDVPGRAADGGAARGARCDPHARAAGGNGEGERAQGCGWIDAAARRTY